MKFGELIRERREAKNIGLRQMARMLGVSPTYLSKVERDEFAPPAEDKVKAIAELLDCDADDLLAQANRVSSDILDIIKSRPIELAELVRSTKGLSPDGISSIIGWAKRVASIPVERLPAELMRITEGPGAKMRWQELRSARPRKSDKPTGKDQ